MSAGGGNSAIDLEVTASHEQMQAINAVPLHDTYDVERPRIVAPGDPARSILLWRLSTRGRGQMPPLATAQPDARAVQLITQWIRTLTPAEAGD